MKARHIPEHGDAALDYCKCRRMLKTDIKTNVLVPVAA